MSYIPEGRTRPWLFEVFPRLKERVPWVPLIKAPTPVRFLSHVSSRIGRDVWVKRDDLSAEEYGGNKPRKLEFIMGDAERKNKNVLVTGGGIGTNHGLATAIFGKRKGFQVALGLFNQPLTDHVRKNLRLFHAYGAEMKLTGGMVGFGIYFYVTERLRRPRAYFVDPGGSSAVGTLGYVDAGLELGLQVKNREMPEPEKVYVAAGSCGTLAGTALGLKLAGLKSRVIGIQVAPSLVTNTRLSLKLARRTHALMKGLDPGVPDLELNEGDVTVDGAYLGEGYGCATENGRLAAELMAEVEGIHLDLTYTAKTFAALCDQSGRDNGNGPVLFLNSFNSVDLSAEAERVDYHDLPREFHRFFQSG